MYHVDDVMFSHNVHVAHGIDNIGEFCAGNCTEPNLRKMRTLVGKCKYLRANCKICELCEKLQSAGRKFAQKLCTKAKFAKNCNFARKGEICAKIAPRKIAIFFTN